MLQRDTSLADPPPSPPPPPPPPHTHTKGSPLPEVTSHNADIDPPPLRTRTHLLAHEVGRPSSGNVAEGHLGPPQAADAPQLVQIQPRAPCSEQREVEEGTLQVVGPIRTIKESVCVCVCVCVKQA